MVQEKDKKEKKALPEEQEEMKEEPVASEEMEDDEPIAEDIKTEETDVVENAVEPEEENVKAEKNEQEKIKDSWDPKTEVGRKVKSGEIVDIEYLLDNGRTILEKEIVEVLVPNLQTDLLLIGQSKGKFGGGQRRVFKQTQKKTREGNKPHFATYSVVGNGDGLVGIGYGKSKETVPAREKAIRNAKVNIFKINRGCGSWECFCKDPHSIPYSVKGKCGSVEIELIPAPKGTGLKVEKECQKILSMAGIKDVWSKTKGQTKTKINLVLACEEALRKLISTKVQPKHVKELGIIDGSSKASKEEDSE